MPLIRPGDLKPLAKDDRFSTGPTVLEFWQWAMSDLRMNNARGYLAEFLVAKATGSPAVARIEWAPYDVLTSDGVKVEVKAAGYLQSWTSATPTVPRWTYKSIDSESEWDETEARMIAVDPNHRVDVWVFALQTCRDPDSYDPLDIDQWEFRVVPHRTLRALQQRSIGIGALEAEPIEARAVRYGQLSEAVKKAAAVNDALD